MDGRAFVSLFHILFVGILFLYVAIMRDKNTTTMFNFLLGLGIFIILYHIFKVYNYILNGKPIWVNLIHIFIIGPLVAYIGYYKQNTPRLYFEILLMLAFASIGYHGYYFVQSII
jgi:heme A synthase